MESVPAKHLLHRTRDGSWFGTNYTMNLYRGCCHGCLYCDSRSDCYHIPDFDRVTAKADALPLLRDELARKVRPAFIGMGSMSDPYTPFEEELLLTRHALELIDAYGCDQSNLIAIMQEIQGEYKYLSEGALTLIAEKLGISTAKVYSVATFYENFSLEAKGRHIIKVCTGTACHVRKSGPIYDSLRDALGLTGKRKTSADGLFTLETVACLGACGLAPVMTIDGEVHAKMTPEDALALVEDIRRKEAATA